MAQRKKRWLASCGEDRGGRAGQLGQQNARRTRNLRVFFNRFADRTQAVDEGPTKRQATKNRARSDEKSSQNRRKIDIGASGAPPVDSGTPRDATRTPAGRPKARPRRSQSAPGAPQGLPERSWDVPGRAKNAQERSGRGPETHLRRVGVAERSQKRLRIDF